MSEFGVSPLTGIIYMGKTKALKGGPNDRVWTTKTDVTDAVIKAVYEWFMFQAKNNKEQPGRYGISYGKYGKLVYQAPELEDEKC
jgi:hypothetical protein